MFKHGFVYIKDPPKKPSSPRRRTKLEKYRQEKAAAMAGTPKGMSVADDDFYKLIEVDELKYQLQVCINRNCVCIFCTILSISLLSSIPVK